MGWFTWILCKDTVSKLHDYCIFYRVRKDMDEYDKGCSGYCVPLCPTHVSNNFVYFPHTHLHLT